MSAVYKSVLGQDITSLCIPNYNQQEKPSTTMSLTLLQGYSSSEEQEQQDLSFSESSDDEHSQDHNKSSKNKPLIPNTPLFNPNDPSSKSSSLPSAFDVFSQVYLHNILYLLFYVFCSSGLFVISFVCSFFDK